MLLSKLWYSSGLHIIMKYMKRELGAGSMRRTTMMLFYEAWRQVDQVVYCFD